MPETRLKWHLVQCVDKQRLGHLFDVCPYNAIHHIPKEQFAYHKAKCPDRTESDPQLRQEMQEVLDHEPVSFSKDAVQRGAAVPAASPNDIYLPGPNGDQPLLQYLPPPPGFEHGPAQYRAEEVKQLPQPEEGAWVTVKAKAKPRAGQVSAEGKHPVPRNEPQNYTTLAQFQLSKDVGKRRKTLKKRLKEITKLEGRRDRGEPLEPKEAAKVAYRASIEEELRGIPK